MKATRRAVKKRDWKLRAFRRQTTTVFLVLCFAALCRPALGRGLYRGDMNRASQSASLATGAGRGTLGLTTVTRNLRTLLLSKFRSSRIHLRTWKTHLRDECVIQVQDTSEVQSKGRGPLGSSQAEHLVNFRLAVLGLKSLLDQCAPLLPSSSSSSSFSSHSSYAPRHSSRSRPLEPASSFLQQYLRHLDEFLHRYQQVQSPLVSRKVPASWSPASAPVRTFSSRCVTHLHDVINKLLRASGDVRARTRPSPPRRHSKGQGSLSLSFDVVQSHLAKCQAAELRASPR